MGPTHERSLDAEAASSVYFPFADTDLAQALMQVLGTEMSKPVSTLKERAARRLERPEASQLGQGLGGTGRGGRGGFREGAFEGPV